MRTEIEQLLLESKKRHFRKIPHNPETRHHKSSKSCWRPEKNFIRYDRAEPINEKEIKVSEINCSEFGCGNTLTMTEKLFGNKCVDHQFKKEDIFHNGKL